MSDQITLRAFHAVSEPETAYRFFQGHVNVLKSYGVDPISSARKEWTENPAVFGIIAERGTEVVGGVKIHKTGGTQMLPVEEGVGYMDERLYDIVRHYGKTGAGEACGLWNARDLSGWGLSRIMMIAIVALAEQIEVQTLFGLSSDHTLPLFQEFGYEIIRVLGNNGDFVYPTPDYLARVIIMDAKTLSRALPYNREVIFALRAQPEQLRQEKSNKGVLNINYKLKLPGVLAEP